MRRYTRFIPSNPNQYSNNQDDIRIEMDRVISELKEKGVTLTTNQQDLEQIGLGDVVESVLTKFGITQERYKSWFGLDECNCTERKEWLNNFFSWQRR
jgi:hypothetical protein